MRHAIIFSAGCAPDASPEEEQIARQLCMDVPEVVFGEHVKLSFAPNALDDFHDMRDVFAENLPRLKELKRMHDPYNKLKGPISP
jgi:hypothetical protein